MHLKEKLYKAGFTISVKMTLSFWRFEWIDQVFIYNCKCAFNHSKWI